MWCVKVACKRRHTTKTKQTTLVVCSASNSAEREGFEPPEPRSSTVFKTAAIDHSATSPRDKSITSFLIYQTKNENIFHFFTATTPIILKLNNIRMQHFFRLFKAFSLYSAKIPKLAPLNLLSKGLQICALITTISLFVLSATPEDGAWRGPKSAYRPPF